MLAIELDCIPSHQIKFSKKRVRCFVLVFLILLADGAEINWPCNGLRAIRGEARLTSVAVLVEGKGIQTNMDTATNSTHLVVCGEIGS